MSEKVVARLSRLHSKLIQKSGAARGDHWVVVKPEGLLEVATSLRDDPELAMDMPVDLTVVDYLGKRETRFEVVVHLNSLGKGHRIRVKVPVSEEDPSCPSLSSVWKGFNWFEREAWDLYGINFEGHPDAEKFGKIRRILLYEGFEGHPLRKDYPKDRRQPLIGPEDPGGSYRRTRGAGLGHLDGIEELQQEGGEQ